MDEMTANYARPLLRLPFSEDEPMPPGHRPSCALLRQPGLRTFRVMHLFIWHRTKATIGIIVGRRGIRQKHHPVIVEHRIAQPSRDNNSPSSSRDDDRINAPLSQDYVEVSPETSRCSDAS